MSHTNLEMIIRHYTRDVARRPSEPGAASRLVPLAPYSRRLDDCAAALCGTCWAAAQRLASMEEYYYCFEARLVLRRLEAGHRTELCGQRTSATASQGAALLRGGSSEASMSFTGKASRDLATMSSQKRLKLRVMACLRWVRLVERAFPSNHHPQFSGAPYKEFGGPPQIASSGY
jgi:hypothetical protein